MIRQILYILIVIFIISGCSETDIYLEDIYEEVTLCITVNTIYEEENLDESVYLCSQYIPPTKPTLSKILIDNTSLLELEINPSSFGDYVSGLKGYNFETLEIPYYWFATKNNKHISLEERTIKNNDVIIFTATRF